MKTGKPKAEGNPDYKFLLEYWRKHANPPDDYGNRRAALSERPK